MRYLVIEALLRFIKPSIAIVLGLKQKTTTAGVSAKCAAR